MSIILQTFIASIAACCTIVILAGCLLDIVIKRKESLAIRICCGSVFALSLIRLAIQVYQLVPFLH